ncbi:probable deoxyribose-phosphate aldolase [Candidatus Vecturithrix granuli]|uniref:Deoxyribose-phosphate aldolase n=1 Tax=Vecturithrix granuli TaxID=1499967 RepID=A0A081C7B1_VECG1|nr:probable deoxyribose-phosphate aldolase [Candidatus Vecturithrix granuli]
MYGITENEITQLVASIDYSEVLTITASENDVKQACADAKTYRFRAVVAFPQYLGLLVDNLKGSGVLAQIPVGFPCGGVTTHVKCTEAEEGLKRGATDLDMVMNIAAFKAGNYKRVAQDIAEVMAIARPFHVPFKVIIEAGVLTDEEIVTAAKLVADSGANFVKTCTGFGPGRATIHNIALIKATVGEQIGIKASGGVASIEDGVALMRAGATVVAMRQYLVTQLKALGLGISGF